jgi:hypothetical protein
VTKRGTQASRKVAARKIGFLEVPYSQTSDTQRHTKGTMMNRINVPIAQLSFTQKLDLMEMLWADMAGNEKNSNLRHGMARYSMSAKLP